ncbi:hypothetical protein T11_3715 [Trichinella zimbabwensis]|uniref:Uncharacterized protein n=1 Tax=Trichinella zimbabwensis TaxID=268475 RepID=A0A0V1GKC6_9BILA|nr:hypothetical protein T11_3715 [Trichinella zimbabwensis]
MDTQFVFFFLIDLFWNRDRVKISLKPTTQKKAQASDEH